MGGRCIRNRRATRSPGSTAPSACPWGFDTGSGSDLAERIRVLVVDDHDFLPSQVVTLVDTCNDMAVVGQCLAGEQVVDTAARVQPDVVLMDVHMGTMSGLAATRALLAVQPAVRVLVLSASRSDTVLRSYGPRPRPRPGLAASYSRALPVTVDSRRGPPAGAGLGFWMRSTSARGAMPSLRDLPPIDRVHRPGPRL